MKFNQSSFSVQVNNESSKTAASPINLSGTERDSFTSFTFCLHQFSIQSVSGSEYRG
jgi:hypothetical protein